MSSQTHDLHRALLRPFILHTLRAMGFHSTKPSVLETLLDITERYILLLASTTAKHAINAHNDAHPTITDVRMAMRDCGVLIPAEGGSEEVWRELMRLPVGEMEASVEREGLGAGVGAGRARGEKRKREEEDLADVRQFTQWFDGNQPAEIRRVAGMAPESSSNVAGVTARAVGVGGGVVQAEDFLTVLKKKNNKTGDDGRLHGTVLARQGGEEGRSVVVEGGPVQHVRDWRPKLQEKSANTAVMGRKESVAGVTKEDNAMMKQATAR